MARTRLPPLALAALALFGCNPTPRAPALQSGGVHQNEREGFRFLAPEGWVQRARADLPDGPFDKEQLLVAYARFGADRPASLEVSLVDLPEGADLRKFLTAAPSGGVNWQAKGAPEPIVVNGVAATRFTLTGGAGKRAPLKEVVAFRRGGRVYLFAGLFAAGDADSRDEVRRAVGSVVWKG